MKKHLAWKKKVWHLFQRNFPKFYLVQNRKSQLLTINWGTLLVLSIGGTFRLPRTLNKRKYSASKRIFLDVFLQLRIEKSSLVSSCSNLSSSWREIEETNQRFQINQWGKQKRSLRGWRSSRVIYGAAYKGEEVIEIKILKPVASIIKIRRCSATAL